MAIVLRRDEERAINLYEYKLYMGLKKSASNTYVGDDQTRTRVVLAVFRHVIEDIMQWSPEQALANFNYALIRNLNLVNEWNNLCVPREVKQYKTVKYVVAMLYPQYMSLFTPKKLTIQVYRSSLVQRKGVFPKNYFLDAEGEERARICLRHMLSVYAVYPDFETMYYEFSNTQEALKLLSLYGLKAPAMLLYDSPLDYLHDALPSDKKNPFLYNYLTYKANHEKLLSSISDTEQNSKSKTQKSQTEKSAKRKAGRPPKKGV